MVVQLNQKEQVDTETGELVIEKTEAELRNDDFGLKYADKKMLYEVMSVPSLSGYEYRMVTYLVMWARKHNVQYEFDNYGNLYFTKGELKEGEYYPCVTAHLDTVQDKHKAFILAGADLDVRTRLNKENKHELYVDGIGIGADDKGAIFISLAMIDKIDVIKGAFFLEEEVGMKGSSNLNKSFFDNVGYVVGFDSPDYNRSAWKCSGTKLFTGDFYKTYMKPVCDKFGYTRFYSEPYTDVKHIVEKAGIMCMNFCNGGYEAHNQSSEYIVAEETDNALGMGLELVETIGRTRHEIKSTGTSWVKDENGVYHSNENDDDKYLATLGDDNRYSSYNYYNYSANINSSTTNSNLSNTSKSAKSDGSNNETLMYIVSVYEKRISNIADEIKAKCEMMGIDYDKNFKSIFETEIKF